MLVSPTPRGERRELSGAADRQLTQQPGDARAQRLPHEVVLHPVVVMGDHVAHPLDLDPLDRRELGLERVRQPLDDRRNLDDLLTAGCPQDLPLEAVLEVGLLALAHDAGREPAHAREIGEMPLDAFVLLLPGHNGTASRRARSMTGPWERPEAMSTCTPMTDSSSSVRSMTSSRSVPSGKVTMRSRSDSGVSSPRATDPNTMAAVPWCRTMTSMTSRRWLASATEGRTRRAASSCARTCSVGVRRPVSIAAMVGWCTPERSARARWLKPSRRRAARSCAPTSVVMP